MLKSLELQASVPYLWNTMLEYTVVTNLNYRHYIRFLYGRNDLLILLFEYFFHDMSYFFFNQSVPTTLFKNKDASTSFWNCWLLWKIPCTENWHITRIRSAQDNTHMFKLWSEFRTMMQCSCSLTIVFWILWSVMLRQHVISFGKSIIIYKENVHYIMYISYSVLCTIIYGFSKRASFTYFQLIFVDLMHYTKSDLWA
jgi:hypothetical protein